MTNWIDFQKTKPDNGDISVDHESRLVKIEECKW